MVNLVPVILVVLVALDLYLITSMDTKNDKLYSGGIMLGTLGFCPLIFLLESSTQKALIALLLLCLMTGIVTTVSLAVESDTDRLRNVGIIVTTLLGVYVVFQAIGNNVPIERHDSGYTDLHLA